MSSDVVVVGGGVIGLATAWRCAQRELRVTLVDPAPGEGASATAAGMLAPVTELHYEGRELLSLNLESARRYPAFAAELQDESGVDVGYRECGTVVAAWDAADLAQLRDHQVDNRQLVRALLKVIDQHHITVVRRPVRRIGREVEVDDGSSIAAATIVLAAGAWSRGLDPDAEVRPVKGQTVRLRTRTDLLNHVVRGSVRGNPSTWSDAPAVNWSSERPVRRPAYRNGILLTPVTADEIARLVATGETSDVIAPFAPDRTMEAAR